MEIDPETNLEFWSRAYSWSLDEAVALTVEINPSERSLKNLRHNRYLESRDTVIFFRLRDLAGRAESAGRLSDPIRPVDFIRWIKESGLVFPPELEERVIENRGIWIDWKFESEKAHAVIEHCQRRAVSLGQRIEELEAELVLSRQDGTDARSGSDVAINRKSFNTLLKLVGGLAMAGYGYNPIEKRSEVIGTMQTDLALKGVDLEADTIRKWVKQGIRFLSDAARNV